MSEENATQPAATPSEPAASPERAGASAPVDGGQPNGEAAQPTEGTQPVAAPGEGEGGAQPPKPVPEHRTVQGRISEYQKRAREAELVAAEERGRRLALEEALRGGARPSEAPPAAPPAPKGPPDPKDATKYPQGEYDPKYAADLALHILREEQRAEQEATAQTARDAAAREAFKAGKERLSKTLDLADAAADGPNGQHFQNAPRVLEDAARMLPPAIVDLITESDNPVHVAELLGRGGLKDMPIDLAGLKGLSHAQATRVIAKMDAHVSHALAQRAASPPAPTRTAPQITPAPTPVPTPEVSNSGGSVFNPERASFQEFEAHFARIRGNTPGA